MGHARAPISYVPSFGQRARSLRPPNLPRFAAGLPSTSTRSRAKSIVGALLKLVPTPKPSTPASRRAGIDFSSTEPDTKIFTSLWPRRSNSQRTSRTIAAKLPRREAGVSSRMHATDAEREDLLSVRELSDPRRLRRDAARLTDHPEDRRLVQRPLFVRAFEGHDGKRDASVCLRWEDAAFREGPQAYVLSLQKMHDLLKPAEEPPRPVVRQGTGRDLGDNIGAAPTRLLQDVERPHEVEVRRPSRPDLVRGGDVEVTTRRGLGHFSRSGYFLRLLELLHSARARDYAFAAMVSGCFAGELPRGRRGLDPTPEESTGLGCGHVVDPVVLVVGRPGTRLMAPVQTLGSTARWANVDRTYSGGITALAKKRGSERWGLRSLPRTKKDPVCFLSSASGSPIPSQERTTRVRCQ